MNFDLVSVLGVLISLTIGVATTRGFARAILRPPNEPISWVEWLISTEIGLMVSVMVFGLFWHF